MDGSNKNVQKESWKDKVATYVREISGDDLTVVSYILSISYECFTILNSSFLLSIVSCRLSIWTTFTAFADTSAFKIFVQITDNAGGEKIHYRYPKR